MDQVHQVIRRASVWFHLGCFLRILTISLTLLTGVMLATHVASRLLAFAVDWRAAWIWGAVAAALGAFVWTMVMRRQSMAVAQLVDEGAGLKESLSTALSVEGQDDPWSRAAVEQARLVSARVVVRQAIPLRAPRLWPAPFIVAGLFLLAGLIPQMDLLGLVKKAEASETQRIAVEQAKKEVQAIEKELEKTLSKVGAEKPDDDGAGKNETPKPQTPDEIRREALKKLTTAQDRLSELSKGEKSDMLKALKDKMNKLDGQADGPLSSLTKSLQQGNFEAAKQALSDIQKELASGNLSEADKKKLAEQMNKLAAQLAELSKDQKALEEKLKEAGLNPELAKNADALKKALEEAKGLSPEQRDALQKMAKANSQAAQACKKMGGACAGMAAAMNDGQNPDAAAGQMGEQLSEMEMAEGQMAEIGAAQAKIAAEMDKLGQCMGNMDSDSDQFRPGPGRYTDTPQQGAGQRDMQQAAFNTKKEKAESQNQGGPIIGSTLVEGEQVRGESVQQFSDAVAAAEGTATEAIESKQIPREYHEAIKQYFGRLKKKAAAPATAPANPPAPAAPAPAAADPKDKG